MSLLLTILLLAAPPPPERLPPAECVRLVRSARIAQAAGNVEEAIRLLSQAEERFPREILPVQELLRLYQTTEVAGERESELRALLSRRLEDPSFPLAPGTARVLIDRVPDDTEVLESLRSGLVARVEVEPRNEYLAVLAVVQGRLGRYEDARETLGKLIETEATFPRLAEAVRIDLELERWQEALDLITPIVEDENLGPAFTTIYVELLAKTGESERVVEEVERLRAAGAGEHQLEAFRMLLRQIAWDLYDSGARERSEELWEMVLEYAPEDLEAQLVLANLFSSEEERLAREADVDRQLETESEPGVLMAAGVDYLTAGDDARAYDLLSRAVPHFADKEGAWFNLGLAAMRLEMWEETVRAFSEAISLNRGRAESHSHLATGLRQLERYEEAAAALERAVKLDPGRTVDYYYLSRCYLAMGDSARAAEAMDEYDRLRSDG